MAAVNEFVDVIRSLINQEMSKNDRTALCRVDRVIDENHADVCILPDETNIIHNIPNASKYLLKKGDYVYIYIINNQIAKSYIITKTTPTVNDNYLSSATSQTTIINNSNIGGGGGEDNVHIYSNLELPVSSWVSDSTIPGFSFKGSISLNESKASSVPYVILDQSSSMNKNFSTLAQADTGVVYLWCKVKPEIDMVIPKIILFG